MYLSYNYFFFKLYCIFFAKKAGEDKYGNVYYFKKNKSPINNFRDRRFVLYKGVVEASKIPQEWNAWLHHMSKEIPKRASSKPKWIKEHVPNLTGTPFAYEYKDRKNKKKLKNVYSVWSPDE